MKAIKSSAKPAMTVRTLESVLTVADHIELMQMGRITAIGLYPDRTVVMHVPTSKSGGPAHIAKLTLLLTVKGLSVGRHMVDSMIVFPDGAGGLAAQRTEVTLDREGAAINLLMSFMPFPVLASGEFQLRVTAKGYQAEASFWIVQRDLLPEITRMANQPMQLLTPPADLLVTRKAGMPTKPKEPVKPTVRKAVTKRLKEPLDKAPIKGRRGVRPGV